MLPKEIISLHIGQSGIQIGAAMWELFLIEHNINVEGDFNQPDYDDKLSSRSFFYECLNGKCVPLAILIDSDSDVIDEIKTGVFRNLFNATNTISGTQDGANSFVRGSLSLGKKNLLKGIDLIRNLCEKCDRLQGFILNHSYAGGTGSGLTNILLHALKLHYLKTSKCQMPIYSGNKFSTSVIDPYNTTLHIHSVMDVVNICFILDNFSLFEMCKNLLNIYSPFYNDVNRIIAVLISSITCSMRFHKPTATDLKEVQTNLIPYPRVHFPIIGHAPISNSLVGCESSRLCQLLKSAFQATNQTIRCNINSGSFMGIMLIGRGDISISELSTLIPHMKEPQPLKFVEWCPKRYKVSINYQVPMTVPESGLDLFKKSLTILCNNTSLKNLWNEIGMKFDALYRKRAYVHLFVEDGMEESEFVESRLDVAMLWEEYEEISMTVSEIEKELDLNPSKSFQYSSKGSSRSTIQKEL